MPNFDLIRISKIIKDLERLFTDLHEMSIYSANDLKNKGNYYAVSMILFSIINRAIDLGDEIVASLNVGIPSTYRDIFSLLRRNDYISDDLLRELNILVHDRNLLSHEYYDFDEQDVFNILQRINTVSRFVDRVKEIVREK